MSKKYDFKQEIKALKKKVKALKQQEELYEKLAIDAKQVCIPYDAGNPLGGEWYHAKHKRQNAESRIRLLESFL